MRIYPAGHPATLLTHAVAPLALVGWTRVPTLAQAAFLPVGSRGLPPVPRLLTLSAADAVRQASADLVVDCGDPAESASAARVAAAAGVPFLHLDGHLSRTAAAVRRLGTAVGVGEAADRLADTVDACLDLTRGRLAGLRLHYGTGPDGREAPRPGSPAMELFDHLGAEVLTLPPDRDGVTASDLAGFDPDLIILLDPEAPARFKALPDIGHLRAVRDGQVAAGPDRPWFWLDRPPGINRVLGALWLCHRAGGGDLHGEIATAFAALTHGDLPPVM